MNKSAQVLVLLFLSCNFKISKTEEKGTYKIPNVSVLTNYKFFNKSSLELITRDYFRFTSYEKYSSSFELTPEICIYHSEKINNKKEIVQSENWFIGDDNSFEEQIEIPDSIYFGLFCSDIYFEPTNPRLRISVQINFHLVYGTGFDCKNVINGVCSNLYSIVNDTISSENIVNNNYLTRGISIKSLMQENLKFNKEQETKYNLNQIVVECVLTDILTGNVNRVDYIHFAN